MPQPRRRVNRSTRVISILPGQGVLVTTGRKGDRKQAGWNRSTRFITVRPGQNVLVIAMNDPNRRFMGRF
ncbi:hypothetical protein [Alicyclobacillus acidoterrestris]|uniref:Uncharacterized protein n=1 Tax=Alicyclobacillus acidoterrestris (strain ATCC 49025 / DSM 3922 / CIP 106132 / NCIMB 13137 / GD3B) TaxID=1356854 RepID=T0DCK8_ALIAG|nr:hypothetical protein [Alicyclobacillus acidoterrestris]EPZ47401.1 hypothetical protein N007_06210 [Alicyclobacillus acidoterrestris ATCC 49025]UNO48300.1 hypothetical protein K1I37_16735 [Alicyclobacillus acidoterrestris]